MESYMVSEQNDNTKGINSENALSVIKTFVAEKFPDSQVIKEYNTATGFWGIDLLYKETIISFESDRGGLDCFLTISNTKYPLWQFDRTVSQTTFASEKNINIALNILYNFFKKQ